MASAIPNDWLCPITLSVMRDPVIAEDGHSYERSAITEWFKHNNTSPKTNLRLISTHLVANIALRNTIQEYFAKNPSGTTTTQSTYKDSPLTLAVQKNDTHIHIRVEAADAPSRKPIDLIAIVDNSGSMAEIADAEAAEPMGYTRMDLVKHTIRTMAAVLQPQDTLSIVSYSTSARVVIRPTAVTEQGRASIHAALDTIQPDSQTNIYDGIRQAAMLANSPELAGRNIVALLLTDGFPNVNPPRGIVQTLRSMELKNRWSLHTFGFGYKLDSALLTEIAQWGNGLFGFIPDCSMVATIFINFLSNMLCTASSNAAITLGDAVFQTGPILFGQPRDFVFPLPGDAPICKLNGDVVECSIVETIDSFANSRSQYILALEDSITKAKKLKYVDALLSLESFFMSLQNNKTAAKEFMRDIHGVDPEGQVGMAPTEAYFIRWGEHYMRSYLRAQQLQQCMNFKDPGLQIYGGDLFHENQAAADKAFDALPPPQPSGKPPAPVSAYAGGYASPPSLRSLTASFNNPSGGCFGGGCKIRMADGSKMVIQDIRRGDLVWTPSGPAHVVALVTCNTKAKSQPMSRINGLSITPWHPILVEGEWKFPGNLYMYSERMVQTVYNLVLERGHIVDVEGTLACTLAHGFEGPVIGHDFFGTDKIIMDLMKVPGWGEGRPTFTNLVAVKDPDTNLIVEWRDVV